MKKTLEFILNGSDVTRYHTLKTHTRETVGHHSHGVAMLCFLLTPTPSRSVLVAALFHDLAEQYTGDIPSPAKRVLNISQTVNDYEHQILKNNGIIMPELTNEESRLLKLADIAHGALFCVKEMQMGNKSIRKVFDRYISYAEELHLTSHETELFNTIKEYAL